VQRYFHEIDRVKNRHPRLQSAATPFTPFKKGFLMKFLRLLALLAVLLWGGISAAQDDEEHPSGTPEAICEAATPVEPATLQFAQPEQVLEADVDYRAIVCTDVGAIYVDLLEEYAPITVNSFVFLAGEGYYNASQFHRVMKDFMAQGGDPVGNPPGTGGPGYQFEDEFVGFLTFDRPGLLAMANAGPATNGSQFFITTVPTPHLNYKHTIFGEVLQGYDNVVNIRLCDPDCGGEPGTIVNNVIIITEPDQVTSTFQSDAAIATAEDIEASLGELTADEGFPPDLEVSDIESGIFTSAEIVAKAPPEVQEAYTAFLAGHSHDYRVRVVIDNTTCTDQVFFTAISYTVDAFASADDASAALADPALVEINAASGYTPDETNPAVFTQEVATCSDETGQAGRLYLQRGRYLVIVEGIFSDTILQQAPIEAILSSGVAFTFESFLSDEFRSELH
jgi:cyclophilin family peptidyl-prolyl cis-trans isomerase